MDRKSLLDVSSSIKSKQHFQLYLLWFILIWFSAFCSKNTSGLDCPENQNTHSLVLADSITFPLDTNSNPDRLHFHYSEFKEKAYFYFHNPFEHAIYLYDYNERQLIEIIKLYPEGPNAISRNISGVYFIDPNSIAIIEKASGYLKIIDHEAQVQKKMHLFDGNIVGFRASPNSNESRPLIYHDQKLYLVGLALGVEPIPDHTKLMNAYEINIVNDKVNVFLPRPSIYNDGQYGMFPLYQIYCTENIDRTGILYGFGLSPTIHEMKYGDIKQLEPRCLKSDLINEIKPYEADRDNWHYDNAQMMVYDQNISYYANIYSLPESRHYVRFNSIGANFDGGTFRKNSFSIFDEKFNKLGEVPFPENLEYGYRMFSNRVGLHLMKAKQDEDNVTYYIYKVVEKS